MRSAQVVELPQPSAHGERAEPIPEVAHYRRVVARRRDRVGSFGPFCRQTGRQECRQEATTSLPGRCCQKGRSARRDARQIRWERRAAVPASRAPPRNPAIPLIVRRAKANPSLQRTRTRRRPTIKARPPNLPINLPRPRIFPRRRMRIRRWTIPTPSPTRPRHPNPMLKSPRKRNRLRLQEKAAA